MHRSLETDNRTVRRRNTDFTDYYSNKGEFFVSVGWELIDSHNRDTAPTIRELVKTAKADALI